MLVRVVSAGDSVRYDGCHVCQLSTGGSCGETSV